MIGKKARFIFALVSGVITMQLITGCSTPINTQPSYTRTLDPDEADNIGGSFLESSDIRTIAAKMSAGILSVPEIAEGVAPVRIAMAPLQNSTRYIFNKDILARKLRIELTKYAKGQVRFFSQNRGGQQIRQTIIHEQDENKWQRLLDNAATQIAASPLIRNSRRPLRIGIIPPKSINLTDMNADSFMIMLRSSLLNKVSNQISFVSSIRTEGDKTKSQVDYWLTGEFFAEGITEEKLHNQQANIVGWALSSDSAIKVSTDIKIRQMPNIAKRLNILLINAKSHTINYSKLLTIGHKVKTGLGRADIVLTGDISGFHKAAGGDRSDYVIVSFQLIDYRTNEILWEDDYETKKVTNRSAVYK